MWSHGRRSLIHLWRQRARREIPHELARLPRVAQSVLLTRTGKADDGRRIGKGIEKAVRREIEMAVSAARGDPPDGTWPDDCVERIMRQSVTLRRLAVVGIGLPCH